MFLDEKNCEEKINALTYQDWLPLLELIPKMEKKTKFGGWAGGYEVEEGVIELPYTVLDNIVLRFLEIVYEIPIIIGFEWGAWNEGRKIVRDDNFDFDTIDLVTKCKLITAIVRNDRFCEGALLSAFESGLILKILKSIEQEVNPPLDIVP